MKLFRTALLSIALVLSFMGMELNAANPPVTQAGFITFQNVNSTGAKVNWVNGSGAGRIVVVSTAYDFDANQPENNTVYSVEDQGNFASATNPTLGAGKVIYNGTGSLNSVDVTGLGPNTTYWFRVYEFNQGGIPSPAYNTSERTLNPRQMKTAPAAPINVNVTDLTSYSALIKWTAPAGATSYRLDLSTAADFSTFEDPYNDLDIGDITEWLLTDLNQSTTYYIRLRSVANGLASSNALANFTTNAADAPVFDLQYYADEALTDNLGASPRLKAGTYYLALTSNQPLSEYPKIQIDANGNGTWETPPDVTPAEWMTAYGDNVYVYKRVVTQHASLDGANPENYVVDAKGLSGLATDMAHNAAINGYPTGAAYIDTEQPTVVGVSAKDGNADYKAGDNIILNVQFSEIVRVTGGSPRLLLDVGGAERYATYNGTGSNSNTLEFLYTVQSGDDNPHLDYVATNSLGLNGAQIKDIAGNIATLTLPAPGAAGSLSANNMVNVDGVIPTITNVTSDKANGTYGAGSEITIQVTFSEDVPPNIALGAPYIVLNTVPEQNAIFEAYDAGTFTATFKYTVQNGDYSADLDYASTDAFKLNGAVIEDAAGNTLDKTLPAPGTTGSLGANKNIVIDAVQPAIVNVTSDKADGIYGIGEVISIQVEFNKKVDVVGGTPSLNLNTGGVANYISGSGGQTLTFEYTVLAGHQSNALDYVNPNSFELNGATIKDVAATNALLTLANPGAPGSLAANKNIAIDGVVKTVQNVTSSDANGSYGRNSIITITVQFSGVVNVTGTPQLTLNTNPSRTIDYVSGTGTNTLTFTYTVQNGDLSADLDYKETSSLKLNGGVIKDNAGNNANLTLPVPNTAGSLGNNKNIVIDAVAPVVANVSTVTQIYTIGELINITVQFSKNVVVAGGTPTLALNIGGVSKLAEYSTGTGTQDLVFQYTVEAGDNQNPLEYVDVNSLALNGATIYDQVDNNPNAANLVLPALGSLNSLSASNASINTNAPVIQNVSSTPTPAIYKAGDIIPITVQFSETVNVDLTLGTARLRLGIVNPNGNYITRYAIYTGGSGTNTLTFNYTVQNGDNSPAIGLEYYHPTNTVNSAFDLNGATIKSTLGLNAITTLPAPEQAGSLSFNTDITVDTKAPRVVSVSSDDSGPKAAGSAITIKIEFTENVYIDPNSAKLLLETGDIDRYATYNGGGEGTKTLEFTYNVTATDFTMHLDYFDEWSLENVGGFIQDRAGNHANLELPTPGQPGSLSANTIISLVGDHPYVTTVSATNADGNYSTDDVLNITVAFNNDVDVTGTPRLKLETNNGDRYAEYAAGTGTGVLTFNYTIVNGDHSDNLDYTSSTALELNGGTVKRAGQVADALLTLPAPGATHSLGANKDIKIATSAPTVVVTFDRLEAGKAYFDIEFSQDVEGFDDVANDVTVDGTAFDLAIPTVAIIKVDDANYTVTVEGMDQNGNVTVQIPADVANIPGFVTLTNLASNVAEYNFVGTAPTVAITHDYAPTNETNNPTVRFTVTFDMPVNGFDDPTVITENGTANVGNVTITPAGLGMTQYYVDVEVETNGTVGIQIPAGVAQSVGGNIGNIASAPSDLITFTAPAPTITIVLADGQAASTIALPIKFKVTFSENVSALNVAGIDFSGTAIPNAGTATVIKNSDTEYEVAINDVAQNGIVQIKVLAGQVQNDYGTGNEVSDESPEVAYWGIAPTAEITYAGVDPTSVSPINFTVTFDQDVTGFIADDITIGGTANPTTKVVTGGPKVYNVAVSGMSAAGTVNITFLAGAAQNAGGQASLAPVLTKNEVEFEVAAPNVVISRAAGQNSPTGTQPIVFDVVFDQDVAGFGDAGDVVVVSDNAEQGALTVVIAAEDAKNYTVTVSGITRNGTITANVPANVAQNNFAVGNTASGFADVDFQAPAPTITITLADGQAANTATLPIKFKVTFNQDVVNFDANGTGIEIGGTASAGATASVNQITDNEYEVVVTDITVNGTINIKVKQNAVQNIYGTDNAESAVSNNVNYWGIAPTATIERKTASPTTALPIEFTVTFSQQVTGFNADDITFGTSTANPSNITVTPAGPAAIYTVSIANVANNGTVIIAFAADAAENGGGVGNLAPTYQPNEAGVEVTFNMPAPTCILALAGGQNSPTNVLPIAYTATFSQTVTGFNTNGIEATLDGVPLDGGVTITPVGVDGKVYTIEVDGLTTSGELELTVLADAAENQYGEGNTASNAVACVYDITNPTATITLESTDPTNVSPVNYRIVFSKPVFGFDADDLTVTGPFAPAANVVITPFGLGGTTWDIAITGMNADGLISVSIDENKVTDLVGNGNIAAGPVTCQYNLPPMPPPGPELNALSVRYYTRTTIALGINQPALPSILIGKQTSVGPLAPVLTGDIANYEGRLSFNSGDILADGSCVLYIGTADQVLITGLQRNQDYTFALYTYNPETGLYCDDANAALLTQKTQNRESILEQDIPGAIAGTNLALTPITPNPVVNNVNITLDLFTDANITIEVVDGNGQVVAVPVIASFYAEGTHNLSFAMQNLASGSYFLRVSTGNEAVVQRFIYMP